MIEMIWMLLGEAKRVFKWRYSIWWACMLVPAFASVHIDLYGFYGGVGITEFIPLIEFSLPFAVAGIIGLSVAYINEMENGS